MAAYETIHERSQGFSAGSRHMILIAILSVVLGVGSVPSGVTTTDPGVIAVQHTYEARIRFEGKVSTTQVRASDGGHAKRLVQQQFPKATVLSVKRVD